MKRKKASEMTGEICTLCCEGHLEAKQGREYFRYGDALVIVEGVPAWVCNKCGERYHHARVYNVYTRGCATSLPTVTSSPSAVPVAHYRSEDEAAP